MMSPKSIASIERGNSAAALLRRHGIPSAVPVFSHTLTAGRLELAHESWCNTIECDNWKSNLCNSTELGDHFINPLLLSNSSYNSSIVCIIRLFVLGHKLSTMANFCHPPFEYGMAKYEFSLVHTGCPWHKRRFSRSFPVRFWDFFQDCYVAVFIFRHRCVTLTTGILL